MDIDVLFALLLADVDSVPFAHEDYLTDRVGDLREEETR